jgi:hypothetical protein
MDQQNLLLVLTIFVAVAAIALVVGAVSLVAIFLISKRTQDKVTELMPTVMRVLGSAETTLAETRVQVMDIGTKTNSILDTTKVQVARIDELLNDASARAKIQLERAEMVLDDAMDKTQSTVGLIHRGIVTPIREVHGVLTGIRAVIYHLGRSRRPSVEKVTADEEMFI